MLGEMFQKQGRARLYFFTPYFLVKILSLIKNLFTSACSNFNPGATKKQWKVVGFIKIFDQYPYKFKIRLY